MEEGGNHPGVKVVYVLPPSGHGVKQYNSNNLREFSPYTICADSSKKAVSEEIREGETVEHSNELVKFTSERLPYVGYAIRDMGLACYTQRDEIHVVADPSISDLYAEEQKLDENDKKSKVARPFYTPAEILVKQLRFASLWVYNYEEWYERLVGITSVDTSGVSYYSLPQKVVFIPLHKTEIRLIRDLIKNKLWYLKPWNEEEKEAHAKLELRLNHLIEPTEEGYFMRLSSHSPKDVPRSLNIKNAGDILSLLVCSERILTDIEVCKSFLYKSKYLQVILIPWVKITAAYEFRCFVHLKKMTAISQYEGAIIFDDLQDVPTLVAMRNAISHYHDQMAPFIPYPSYVFDVYLQKQEDAWRVHLVELNPFYADLSSGSSLFEWKTDMKLLYEGPSGQKEPVLRVRRKTESLQFTDIYVA